MGNAFNYSDYITGQVVFRDQYAQKQGKNLFSFIGIIGVPQNQVFENHKQYTICGQRDDTTNIVTVEINPEFSIDRNEEATGDGLGSLLMQPIWRI